MNHKEIAGKFANVLAFKAHCRRLKKDRYALADKIAIQRLLKRKA